MKRISLYLLLLLGAEISLFAAEKKDAAISLPYAEAGLTKRQAAAHLLDRFAFGAKPGEIDRVVVMGLENWLQQQLEQSADETELQDRLAGLSYLTLSLEKIVRTYPPPNRVRRQAERDGVVSLQDSSLSARERRRLLLEYGRERGYQPLRRLINDMMTNKLLRAVYSENQLAEVLTAFWFNHFYVSLADDQVRPLIAAYERDAIRPNVLGSFREMLAATARHPAMLLYLDNAMSSAPDSIETLLQQKRRRRGGMRNFRPRPPRRAEFPGRKQKTGINENYARELLELHTLGVDGGYTQQDVIEVARAFTGWSVLPLDARGDGLRKRISRGVNAGFVIDGLFVFRADRHDAGEKRILGVSFPAGGGIEEGERVLDLLAAHPATAEHIARKLAVRFVRDDPPQELVRKLAGVFRETNGDLRAMILAIAESPEFWQQETLRAKIKSPFEVVVSALRALDADIRRPRALFEALRLMGQPLYTFQAPTGYPDRADFWINTGALIMRMNFGMYLATGKIPGVVIDLPGLFGGGSTDSPEAALEASRRILLPERPQQDELQTLLPALRSDADFQDLFAGNSTPDASTGMSEMTRQQRGVPVRWLPGNPTLQARAVGLLIGSPEFQRR